MSKQTEFFGTKNDMLEGLSFVDSAMALQYVLFNGPGETDEFKVYPHLGLYDKLAVNMTGKARGAGRFFVLNRGVSCVVSPVEQSSGNVRYFIETSRNPSSIIFDPSGIYESPSGERCLLPGMFGTALSSPDGLCLYREFRKFFLRRFNKHSGNFFIGQEAEAHLEGGLRLPSYSMFADAVYDLKG